MKKRVIVLGCTGSIGSQTIDIIRNMPERFELCGVAAGHNARAVEKLCSEFGCKGTVFSSDGTEGLKNLIESSNADIAVNGIAGAAGLEPSVMVLEAGIDLALANKETVVMAWPVILGIARKSRASIIPVDSEHSAVFNLTQKIGSENISELVITASGGPFRNFTDEQLANVTVEQALKHPTWNMGPKITIDSASLANKGLEVIEACRLFGFDAENVKVVVHPQSLIHSLVRTKDGVLYAQISNPDMRHPIFGALVWPEYAQNYLEPFDLAGNEMSFFKPRTESFPLLKYAYDCAKKGNSYPIAFNASNEIAVQAFIEKKCSFKQLAQITELTLQKDWSAVPLSVNDVFEADKLARKTARGILLSMNGGF